MIDGREEPAFMEGPPGIQTGGFTPSTSLAFRDSESGIQYLVGLGPELIHISAFVQEVKRQHEIWAADYDNSSGLLARISVDTNNRDSRTKLSDLHKNWSQARGLNYWQSKSAFNIFGEVYRHVGETFFGVDWAALGDYSPGRMIHQTHDERLLNEIKFPSLYGSWLSDTLHDVLPDPAMDPLKRQLRLALSRRFEGAWLDRLRGQDADIPKAVLDAYARKADLADQRSAQDKHFEAVTLDSLDRMLGSCFDFFISDGRLQLGYDPASREYERIASDGRGYVAPENSPFRFNELIHRYHTKENRFHLIGEREKFGSPSKATARYHLELPWYLLTNDLRYYMSAHYQGPDRIPSLLSLRTEHMALEQEASG